MGLLTDPMPDAVEVEGARVPLRCDHRTGILVEQADATTPEGRLRVLCLHFGEPAEMHPAVLAHPAQAYEAAVRWHMGAWGLMAYGKGRRRAASARRVLDFDADAAIVAADLLRLYGVDVLDASCELHWWRFCALVLGAAHTDGALVATAVAARQPMPPGLKGPRKREAEARRRAWALPPTQAEMRARAAAEFARG